MKQTSLGKISIATTYLPPRRPYLPFPDFHKLVNNSHPTYIIDVNAEHTLIGSRGNNTVGKGLELFIQQGKLLHLGPHFPTYLERGSATTPDLVLSNNKIHHNIHLRHGPVTSDHIPVIVAITSKAITQPPTSKYNLKRAHWKNFKNLIDNIDDLILHENMSTNNIDENLTHGQTLSKVL